MPYIRYCCGLLKFNHPTERCLCDKYHFIQISHHFFINVIFDTKNRTCTLSLMLGLHRTPKGLGTALRPKNGQTRGYSEVGLQDRMFLLCYSPESHKLLLNYRKQLGWAYSPLKWTSSATAFNRRKRSWNLSISLATDPTRSWILLWPQGWS